MVNDILFYKVCGSRLCQCLFVFLSYLKGANVNAAKIHETALHHAAKASNLEMIELLVEFGGNVFARDNLNKKPIHYTSPGSAAALCLKFYETEPLSLQQLTRIALRSVLGKRALEAVPQLGLPNQLIHYLTYMPTPLPEVLTSAQAESN